MAIVPGKSARMDDMCMHALRIRPEIFVPQHVWWGFEQRVPLASSALSLPSPPAWRVVMADLYNVRKQQHEGPLRPQSRIKPESYKVPTSKPSNELSKVGRAEQVKIVKRCHVCGGVAGQ